MIQQKVIYIAGQGHSGSTLLDMLIASHSKFESPGEVSRKTIRWLFSKSESPRCSCGGTAETCGQWRDIRRLLVNAGVTSADDLLISPSPESLDAFVGAVLSASGRSVYVESSKSVGRLMALLACPALDVHVIHLIRDPRANAFSWRRKDGRLYGWIPRWFRQNRRIGKLDVRPNRLMRVRYEDLVAKPEAMVAAVMGFCGEQFEPEQMKFRTKQHHMTGTNRIGKAEDQAISPDTKYIDALSSLEWWICVALSLGGLRKYGYPLSKQAMRAWLRDGRNSSGAI